MTTSEDPSATAEQAQSLYFQALKKHRFKEYTEAVELLKQALELAPDHTDSWEALGVLYDKTDQLDKAIEAMERLRDLNPDEIMAHTNLSRFYMKKGWTEKAEEAQGKARLLGWKLDLANPQDSELSQAAAGPAEGGVAIASLLDGPGAPEPLKPAAPDPQALQQKIQQFEAILSVNPDDSMALLTLGKTLLAADRPADAVQRLEHALEVQKDYSAAFVILAQAHEANGKLARAIKILKQGIDISTRKGDLHPRNQMQEHLAKLTDG